MAVINPFNFSRTQRIVLLIDLYPFLHLQNPNSYLNSILTSIKLLLSFTPLSNSLFSFKLFFSNLSPLRSSSSLSISNIYNNTKSLSFNCADETLTSVSKTLDSFVSNLGKFCLDSGSRALHLSSSVAEVIHDYNWDLCDDYYDCKSCDECDLLGNVRSNLVVLFSPVCRSSNDLCDFMGIADDNNDDLMSDYDCFADKFRGFFEHVKDAFVSRDIHLSWVDVKYDVVMANDIKIESVEECGKLVGWVRNGVKSLGWGFCSTDSIVLGSALVSYGLIYPMIGVSSTNCSELSDGSRRVCGELNLEILDVRKKPMECKLCDVQLFNLKSSGGQRLDSLSFSDKNSVPEIVQQSAVIWESFGDEVVKIDVKALYRCNDSLKFDEQISDVVLVRELVIDSKRKKVDSSGEFFADRVIDLLLEENGGFVKRKSPPFWQILLSFLCRNDHCALVSLSYTNGRITNGILKPYTIHSAILFVLKNDSDSLCGAQIGESKQNIKRIAGSDNDMGSASRVLKDDRGRKQSKNRFRYKDLSWSCFRKAASELLEMQLEEAYFSKGFDTSKKLKFLKCWINQIAKYNSSFPVKSEAPKNLQKMEERLCQSHQESQRPLPLLAGEHAASAKKPLRKEAGASPKEAAEAFFSNLSQRIDHGISSGVDLLAFAQRVVCSSIYWLRQKIGPDIREESQPSLEKSDGSSYGGLVAGELLKILLRDPKDIAGKHKDGNVSSKALDGQSSSISREDRVREYELQILFRMEILQSEIAAGIRDSAKLKFVKQICRLLEFIQCNMDDGFFGDFNLNDYVGRTIRSRYSQNLGDVVHRIHDQMDFLLFDDGENETPNLLLNSEDSSHSCRVGENDRGSEPNSTDDSIHPGSSTDHDRKLAEAQERRARALRFSSFTRRAMPELQRVWAPKPPKISRSKSDSLRRCKRKTQNRENYDTVCETPMSGPKKRLFPSDSSVGEKEFREQGGSSTCLIHRALFQDESWNQDWGL